MDSDIKDLGEPERRFLGNADKDNRDAYLAFLRRSRKEDFSELEPLREWVQKRLDAVDNDDPDEPAEAPCVGWDEEEK